MNFSLIKSCVVANSPAKLRMDSTRPWLVITADIGGRVFGDRFETQEAAEDFRDRTLAAGKPLRPFLSGAVFDR